MLAACMQYACTRLAVCMLPLLLKGEIERAKICRFIFCFRASAIFCYLFFNLHKTIKKRTVT